MSPRRNGKGSRSTRRTVQTSSGPAGIDVGGIEVDGTVVGRTEVGGIEVGGIEVGGIELGGIELVPAPAILM